MTATFFNNLKFTQRILMYLLPFALVLGPFFSDLFAIFVSIIFIILSIKEKKWHYYKHPLIIIFWTWCIYLILLSILSQNPTLSLESSLFHWRFGFFAIAVWYIIDNDSKFVKNFVLSLCFVFVGVLLDSYIQFFTGYNILGFPYGGVRLSGFFNEELILGSFLSRLLPILLALMILVFFDSRPFILITTTILILTNLLVFLSGERAAFFYLLLSTFIIIFFIKKWKFARIIMIILSFLSILFFTLTFGNVKSRMIDDTLRETNIFGNNVNFFSPLHQAHYKSAFKMFTDNPLIGVGPKIFREACFEKKYFVDMGCANHPHNTYIQLLAETGLIGTIPVVVALFAICFIFLRHIVSIIRLKSRYLSDFQVCLYSAILITLWPIIPTGNFFHNWLNVIYFLPLGFLLHSYNKKN